MKKENLLWKVLRATTNSPTDVWKLRHYVRHKDANKKLLGNNVNRYTVPIKCVADSEYGRIYLVAQFCTDKLDFPFFAIEKRAFTEDLSAKKELVYAINIRLCLESEFQTHIKRISFYGEIKETYREEILKKSEKLIKDKPRWEIMNEMNGKFEISEYDENKLKLIIESTQFDKNERIYKGIFTNEKDSKK